MFACEHEEHPSLPKLDFQLLSNHGAQVISVKINGFPRVSKERNGIALKTFKGPVVTGSTQMLRSYSSYLGGVL